MRYIYDQDIQRWKKRYADFSPSSDYTYDIIPLPHENFLIANHTGSRYAVYCDDDGDCPIWGDMRDPIYLETIRMRLKPIMADPEFSLEEICEGQDLVGRCPQQQKD